MPESSFDCHDGGVVACGSGVLLSSSEWKLEMLLNFL